MRSHRTRRAPPQHPDGIVDLSIGSPVDETPRIVADALAAATDAHSYPQTVGHARAARGHRRLVRPPPRRSGPDPRARAAHRRLEGARRAAAAAARTRPRRRRRAPARRVPDLRGRRPPGGRHPGRRRRPGRVAGRHAAGVGELARQPRRTGAGCRGPPRRASPAARELGAVLASDECYAELGWEAPWDAEPIPSALDPRVTRRRRARHPVGVLAQQAVEPRGLPRRVPRGGPRARRAARDRAQAPRAHAARPGAVRDDRRARR